MVIQNRLNEAKDYRFYWVRLDLYLVLPEDTDSSPQLERSTLDHMGHNSRPGRDYPCCVFKQIEHPLKRPSCMKPDMSMSLESTKVGMSMNPSQAAILSMMAPMMEPDIQKLRCLTTPNCSGAICASLASNSP